MIVRTEAIVLRGIDYGETSRIVTLFTREKGKITIMARGARRPKSRFGSTLEPLSYTEVVFYYKHNRSLQILSESGHVELFNRIGRSLTSITAGLRMLELIHALLQKEEQNTQVFRLMTDVLRRLNGDDIRRVNLLPYFQIRLAGILGFAPAVTREALDALTGNRGILTLDTGAVLPRASDYAPSRPGSREALRAYAVFARASLDDVMRMKLTPALRRETERLIADYVRYHVEEAYPDRGERVMAQLLHDA